MKKTLQILNNLVTDGIIKEYAIAGGMAQFYYIEPSVTYDLDLIVNFGVDEKDLAPLHKLYNWASENHFRTEGEHIILGGIPVQFLVAYNKLISEALDKRLPIELFGEQTFILAPEYLMAILLQTGRPIDKERLLRFLDEADYDRDIFMDILNRFNLSDKFNEFSKRLL